MRKMIIIFSMLLAGSAFAYNDGQTGSTGGPGETSCLACHGSGQFDGLSVTIGNSETVPCSPGGDVEDFEIPLLTVGSTVPVTVTIAESTAPQCPAANCCDGAADGDSCLNRPGSGNFCTAAAPQDCCEPFLNDCTAGAQAGFNAGMFPGIAPDPALADGVAQAGFQAGEDSRVDVSNINQITQIVPKATAGGSVSWSFNYVVPAFGASDKPVFWVGANLANGNGQDDDLDLNSNYTSPIAVTDGTTTQATEGCGTCEDGSLAVNGSCCTCMSASPTRSVFVAFAMIFGLGFLGSRRRR